MDVYKELEELCNGLTDHMRIEIEYRDRETMKNILGRTYFYGLNYKRHPVNPDKVRNCVILLNEKIRCTECMQRGVLWHEVCHCIPWINEGRSDGHSSAFYRRLWSKPLCAFYSICAEFWFGLLDAFD